MTQDIDLQAQMPGESDRAFLAYTTYRDMPLPRSERGAYALYITAIKGNNRQGSSKVGSASRSYTAWVSQFRWAERVKEWDVRKQDRIKAAQIEDDTQAFKQKIEDMRSRLERCGLQVTKNVENQLAICSTQFQAVGAESIASQGGGKAKAKALDKRHASLLIQASQAQKLAIDSLASAHLIWKSATGLEEVIEQVLAKHFGTEIEENLPPLLRIELTGVDESSAIAEV